MEEKSIALEMLEELKRSSKRWFIIALVELFIIVSMICGYFVYQASLEQFEETYQYVEDTDLNNSTLNQSLGE